MSTKETILAVKGMSCGNCVRHVEKALTALAGVSAVEVTLSEGKVRVEHDASRVPVEQMIQAIDDAGYESSVK